MATANARKINQRKKNQFFNKKKSNFQKQSSNSPKFYLIQSGRLPF